MTKHHKLAFVLVAIAIISFATYSLGYSFGKDTALRDNAAEGAE